ncbi:MAG: electron transport complex subunit RsxG [Gammaproteobacteria bacterium]|nr:MAG: electron transport complex subunit RsxG [Gammaproteobacteria bacterium]RKZ42071.1 MAG: electron transport complex subunit RsxG [Gammaproteobacteria bacterium]RKZ75487.1 MAG: electron transport complex subunit RsxG [Gammaproteobacteria bacterium]
MLHAALLLTFFAVLSGVLVAVSFQMTYQQIKANERAYLLRTLNVLIPYQQYDNDLFTDIREVQNEALLGTDEPVMIYRARQAGQPIAAVLTPVAPDGYNGHIRLLVGINYEGILIGVRVLSHKETPGLGDNIDMRRSNWILGFNGRSLIHPDESGWKVKRDGGIFDQFTSATITARAVVKALHNTLLFFKQSRDEIFAD